MKVQWVLLGGIMILMEVGFLLPLWIGGDNSSQAQPKKMTKEEVRKIIEFSLKDYQKLQTEFQEKIKKGEISVPKGTEEGKLVFLTIFELLDNLEERISKLEEEAFKTKR